jgi:hypothetical protein
LQKVQFSTIQPVKSLGLQPTLNHQKIAGGKYRQFNKIKERSGKTTLGHETAREIAFKGGIIFLVSCYKHEAPLEL